MVNPLDPSHSLGQVPPLSARSHTNTSAAPASKQRIHLLRPVHQRPRRLQPASLAKLPQDGLAGFSARPSDQNHKPLSPVKEAPDIASPSGKI